MKMIIWAFGAMAFLAMGLMAQPASAGTAYPLLNHRDRTTLLQYLNDINMEHKQKVVLAAFNRKYEQKFSSFNSLVSFLKKGVANGKLRILSCSSVMHGQSFNTGIYTKSGASNGVWSRQCYVSEYVLVDVANGNVPIISLFCGNLIAPGTVINNIQKTQKVAKSATLTVHISRCGCGRMRVLRTGMPSSDWSSW